MNKLLLVVLGFTLIASTFCENANSNAREIYNFFKGKGWSKNAICALLGNM